MASTPRRRVSAAPAAAAGAAALGTQQFDLASVVGTYQAPSRVGQKVEARGLICLNTENVINLTSLHSLNQACQ